MNIEDKFELMALHRCLLESKFNPAPRDLDLAGSPIVARLANSVVEELGNIDGPQWHEWRIAENHQERIRDLVLALNSKDLSGVPENEKEQFIIDALAPLKAEDTTISKICHEVFSAKSI